MSTFCPKAVALLAAFAVVPVEVSCVPLRDLDETASGRKDASLAVDASLHGIPRPDSVDGSATGDGNSARASEDEVGAVAEIDTGRDGVQGDERGSPVAARSEASTETGSEATPTDGAPDVATVSVPELPDDLPNAPVTGTIMYDVASWEVDGSAQTTFEIRTPTASYTVLQGTGGIISIVDVAADQRQWIDYSSGFRPLRGVPGFVSLPPITTTLDEASRTLTHVRLLCQSQALDWSWEWDFYVTHVTMTVLRTPGVYGFGYRGVPGGLLDAGDQLVFSSGAEQSALSSFDADLQGPAEWIYLVDNGLDRSLFLIQHIDDALPDRYQVKDGDSAAFVFGNGQIAHTPLRFSLGLVESGLFDIVKARVAFVIGAIQ